MLEGSSNPGWLFHVGVNSHFFREQYEIIQLVLADEFLVIFLFKYVYGDGVVIMSQLLPKTQGFWDGRW